MSWETLQAIYREAREEAARDQAEPPRACPNDGTPLLKHPTDGTLRCRFDGWTWPDDGEGF